MTDLPDKEDGWCADYRDKLEAVGNGFKSVRGARDNRLPWPRCRTQRPRPTSIRTKLGWQPFGRVYDNYLSVEDVYSRLARRLRPPAGSV